MSSKRFALVALVLAMSAGLATPAQSAFAAGATTPVLNPVPPDYYTCTTNGAGTYCSGETVVPYGPEPTGLLCGTGASAFEILDQAVRTTQAQRWYDRDGNIVKRRRVFSFADAVLSSPSGAYVSYMQRDIQTDMFPVPGDITYATTSVNGSLRITVPEQGTVLIDKGRVVYGTDGSREKVAGHHDLLNYFQGETSALAGLCGALGA